MSRLVHKLVLALRLIDTTTGLGAPIQQVQVWRNGTLLHLYPRDGGILIVLDGEREDGVLEIRVAGFYTERVDLVYANLSPDAPLLELELIPITKDKAITSLHSLRGQMKGMVALDAVRLGRGGCFIKGYDSRKRIVTLDNPYHQIFDRARYAVVDGRKQTYEVMELARVISDQELKVKGTFAGDFAGDFHLASIVKGRVEPDGTYLLQLREDGGPTKWLVRYQIRDGTHAFVPVDLRTDTSILPPEVEGGGKPPTIQSDVEKEAVSDACSGG
ncbi:hypothetical protein RFF05_09870 [Bengtsoniella intestinalis]|uniref:hypothetical protein n=1 Tax=Bengtsoniella intestinalis TaxID=3073143 RepID=UPI00391F8061